MHSKILENMVAQICLPFTSTKVITILRLHQRTVGQNAKCAKIQYYLGKAFKSHHKTPKTAFKDWLRGGT